LRRFDVKIQKTLLSLLLAALAAFFVLAALEAHPSNGADLFEKAKSLFDEKNYKEAAALYKKILGAQSHPEWRKANEKLLTCQLRLQLFDDAISTAEAYIDLCTGTAWEASAERAAGNLFLVIPHWGTRAGGTFHRGQWKQGIRLQSHRFDKGRALAHLQRARELYAEYDGNTDALESLPKEGRKNFHAERIECLFDLAAACSRFGIYELESLFWHSFWGERDEFIASTAGEEDFDEYRDRWESQRKRPIGLRIGPDGKPLFAVPPSAWSSDLSDDEKILFLLGEIRALDETENDVFTARSYYRQAMLARARWSMDRLGSYANSYWYDGRYPLKEKLENLDPWELGDSEALVLAGGRIMRTELPPHYDVLGLLRIVTGDCRKSGIADEARYAIGLHYQSRQQYTRALAEYASLDKEFPKSDYADYARRQSERIKAPQATINQCGVQLPGEPAALQISHRNTSRIWFVARRIDVKEYLDDFRQNVISEDKKKSYQWYLGNWHAYFTEPANKRHYSHWLRRLAARRIGPIVARWSDEVADDGTHRYAQTTIQSPLDANGAYLVYCYLSEPPAEDNVKSGVDLLGLGASRAVAVLTDLALVEKKTSRGDLIYVADARSGAPLPGAKVSIQEVWSNWSKEERTTYHMKISEHSADDEGMVLFERDTKNNSQIHLLARIGDRIAWSGMHYASRYHPSRIRDGLFAYVITDRPVYRPEQTVRFKIWLRQTEEGILQQPSERSVRVEIYDPRGNKIYSTKHHPDNYGGIDGELTLAEEPPLGVYRIRIDGRVYLGGQNFRVEEYKKPEFEVTVEPAKTHAKLGETVTALIRADYYFGAPVTDATVKYKVFREEYRHSYYFPGHWDWLYGPGYGYAWYSCEWFPWWRGFCCCWSPPGWWWGWYGGMRHRPVRELVFQGEAQISQEGTVEVAIDTQDALRDHGDRDHRYVIEAEVRDASRRVITGQGAVKVTRQAFYSFIQSGHGYYRPGEEMEVTIRCLTPDSRPVETEGVVTVSRVVFGGPDNARIEETELDRWTAKTDSRGIVKFRLRHERSDQLKLTFEAPDSWGGTVTGHGLVWICGRDFDGRFYRFNDLELITDKRTYAPGEVCHLMVNTKARRSHVLLADEVDNGHLLSWRLIALDGGHTIVDIPITREHQPNFFVEACTVADTRVHQQTKRICVPPEEGMIDVTIATDREEYGPGETAEVTLSAREPDGQPVRAQFCLSAFDRSVLYIQPEYTQDIKKFFHGNVRTHSASMYTNLVEQFSARGYVDRPFNVGQMVPPGWWGLRGRTPDWGVVDAGRLTDGSFALNDRLGALGYGGGAGEKRMKEEADKDGVNSFSSTEGEESLSRRALPQSKARGPSSPGPADSVPAGVPALVEAEVRQKFADTALWLTSVETDADGTATVEMTLPENLTTWKVNSWAMTRSARVGQASTEAVTTKNLLVRLQAPRFFMEYDEVVISANVHNELEAEKTARVSIDLPAELLELIGRTEVTCDITVPAHDAVRVDWRVKVRKEGFASITIKALTDEESDAMRMVFPVLVHGITKQVATTGSMRPEETEASHTVELVVPEKRRPELTHFEVQFSPTLIGAMLDALPYCLDYPYGCTEQTMSRFLPALLTLRAIQNTGASLEELKTIRGRMEETRRIEKGEGRTIWSSIDNPIFDSGELEKVIAKGLARIADMQKSDGGWGWWRRDSSNGYMTSYVLSGLCTAQECDRKVDERMIERGMRFLKGWEEERMVKSKWSPRPYHAFSAYVLSMKKQRAAIEPADGDDRPSDLIDRLFEGRDKLNVYGKALLSMTLANVGERSRARTVLQNILQYVEVNEETQVAWLRTPRQGWWYWWNSDIETNAWCLRALVRLEPKSELAPKLVKWLLENRRNGYYWRSTRDTTFCVAAMSEFVAASGEGQPDYTLTLDFDNGAVVKTVRIDAQNLFTCDTRFTIDAAALGGGKHTLKISKNGPGALYYSTYLSYFTKEEDIKAAGLQLKVDRSYFKLVQIPYEVEVEGSEGQKLMEKRLRYERVLVKNGDPVDSGDVIQVELRVTSDNNYTYLCFEDMKPAGCEATELRSGGKGQEGFYSYMELRDEKVVFFVSDLQQGEHLLRYRLRAEVPGIFHALPTVLYGMYVPELRANSDEIVVEIVDK